VRPRRSVRIVLAMAAAVLVIPAGIALAATGSQVKSTVDVRTASVGRARVAAGAGAGYAIKADGSLWGAGLNDLGELGQGDTGNRRLPTRISWSTNWATIGAGPQHCLAIKRDGWLWAWGANDMGQLGIGGSSNAIRLKPKFVGKGPWKGVSAGDEFSVGLKRDGTLWGWGNNFLGQLGTGDTTSHTRPARVGSESDWLAVDAGYEYVLALKQDGSLWAWGGNGVGQLGIGTVDPDPSNENPPVPHPTPIHIGTDTDGVAVSAGGVVSQALKRDGSLWAWGGNGDGQLGLGEGGDYWVPTRVGADATGRPSPREQVVTLR
jgi:trimeric autotransporter adhesin